MARLTQRKFYADMVPQGTPPKLLQELNALAKESHTALAGGLTIADNLDAELKTVRLRIPDPKWHNVGDANEPAFSNGFANYNANQNSLGFRMEPGGLVQLHGVIAREAGAPAPGTVIFPLPAGYKPPKTEIRPVATNSGFGEVRVASSGEVTYQSGGVTYLSLDAMAYYADSPASPEPFAGQGWPILIQHNLSAVAGVVPVLTQLVNGGPSEPVGQPVLDAVFAEDGAIKLRSVYGLTPQRVYEMTLLLFAG